MYGSKILSVAIGLAPAGAVVLAMLGGTYLIVNQLGVTEGTTSKVWGDLTGAAGRSVLATATAAALGGAIALLLRHTAAAIGVVLGYGILVEGVFTGFSNQAAATSPADRHD